MNNNKDTLMKCPFYRREYGKNGIDCEPTKAMDGTAKCTHVFRSIARRDRYELRFCMNNPGWQQCEWAKIIIKKEEQADAGRTQRKG